MPLASGTSRSSGRSRKRTSRPGRPRRIPRTMRPGIQRETRPESPRVERQMRRRTKRRRNGRAMTLTMVMPSPIGRPKRPSRISPCWFDFCHHSWSVRSCRGHDVPHRTLGSLMGFPRLYAEFFLPINTQQFYQLFSMGMPCVSGAHDKYFSLCEPVSFAAARSAWSGIDVATTSKQHRRGRWSSWTKRSTHDNHLCCVICEADIITIHINTKNFRPWSQWVNLCV